MPLDTGSFQTGFKDLLQAIKKTTPENTNPDLIIDAFSKGLGELVTALIKSGDVNTTGNSSAQTGKVT